jgi:hypothetical protein
MIEDLKKHEYIDKVRENLNFFKERKISKEVDINFKKYGVGITTTNIGASLNSGSGNNAVGERRNTPFTS